MSLRFVQSITLNNLKRTKRIFSHRQPKSNLLWAQRSAYVRFTNLFVTTIKIASLGMSAFLFKMYSVLDIVNIKRSNST